MPTLHSLRSRVKTLSRSNPSSDPAADVARIHAMLEPMAGLIGCGEGNEHGHFDSEKSLRRNNEVLPVEDLSCK